MCGIFFSLSCKGPLPPSKSLVETLKRRGPDSVKEVHHEYDIELWNSSRDKQIIYLTFTSTVLALRGESIAVQPLVDEASGSVLCWNGEAWKFDGKTLAGNDSKFIFDGLLQATSTKGDDPVVAGHVRSTDASDDAMRRVSSYIKHVSGPYAFVFYDNISQRIFFGRDFLGRRSLLQRSDSAGELILSSVCDSFHDSRWKEVEADGISVVSLANVATVNTEIRSSYAESDLAGSCPLTLVRIPWKTHESSHISTSIMGHALPQLNKTLPSINIDLMNIDHDAIRLLQQHLLHSLKLRVMDIPKPPSQIPSVMQNRQTRLAILFSGGLDCTVLARLIHDILPARDDIDLLNVAFENPRVVSAAQSLSKSSTAHATAGPNKLDRQSGFGETPHNMESPYETCPDRITGRTSFHELKQQCPERCWRFIEINVPYTETRQHRSSVVSLIHPHNTEMDLSIAYALYFAARGRGIIFESPTSTSRPYTSPARVLLSGLGADELFAGYTRHFTVYKRHGFAGLVNELELDITRLGKRNLGRDDRVMSNWGKEVRFPYLDEDLLKWALQCPIWEKCGFGQSLQTMTDENKPDLEPGKKILRLLAHKLGMKGVAREKKRAVRGDERISLRTQLRTRRFNSGRGLQRWNQEGQKERTLSQMIEMHP